MVHWIVLLERNVSSNEDAAVVDVLNYVTIQLFCTVTTLESHSHNLLTSFIVLLEFRSKLGDICRRRRRRYIRALGSPAKNPLCNLTQTKTWATIQTSIASNSVCFVSTTKRQDQFATTRRRLHSTSECLCFIYSTRYTWRLHMICLVWNTVLFVSFYSVIVSIIIIIDNLKHIRLYELSLICTWLAADGWPFIRVNHPL